MKHTLILLIIILILINCSSNQDKIKYENINLGFYCGMCSNHCSLIIKVEKDKIKLDTTDSFFESDNYLYFEKNDGIEFNKIGMNEFIGLVDLLPDNILDYPDQIGCPDCRDQCGILIKIGEKQIELDPEDYPKEFENFILKYEDINNQIRKEIGF